MSIFGIGNLYVSVVSSLVELPLAMTLATLIHPHLQSDTLRVYHCIWASSSTHYTNRPSVASSHSSLYSTLHQSGHGKTGKTDKDGRTATEDGSVC